MEVSPSPEGSIFSPRHVRILKISIVIMTALLILGILALIYGMTRQASRLVNRPAPAQPSSRPYERTLTPGGSTLAGISATNGLLMLHLKSAGGDTVVVIDASDGREVGRIQLPMR